VVSLKVAGKISRADRRSEASADHYRSLLVAAIGDLKLALRGAAPGCLELKGCAFIDSMILDE
jgi:hypothetical protein